MTPIDSGSDEDPGSDSEYEEYIRRHGYPASCTRSGARYGLKEWWARRRREQAQNGGHSSLITDDIDSASQMQMSRRRLDHISESIGDLSERERYNEVPHLYGKEGPGHDPSRE